MRSSAQPLPNPVHQLSLAEAEAQLAVHLQGKPAAPWESKRFQAWLERKAALELWILLESRHTQVVPGASEPEPDPEPEIPVRIRHPHRRPRRHRGFRRSGVLG